MSCKVLPPGTSDDSARLALRQVGGGADEPAGSRTGAADRLARMEKDFARREAETRTQALHEGEAAGRRAASAELQPVIEKLARAIEEIAGLRGRLRREAEADLVQLALAIARRVLRREISIDPEALRGLALAALEKLQGQEIARVRVHPSQAAVIAKCLQDKGSTVGVSSDPGLEPGGVLFETARGDLDAGVESQLQEIERGLTDRLKESR